MRQDIISLQVRCQDVWVPVIEPLPGYLATERIGAGGYGEVWKATAPGGVEKAVKTLHGYHSEELACRELKALERIKGLPSSHIEEVRGVGLLVGIVFDMPVKTLIETAAKHGLLVINAGENVLRLCPPLIVSKELINQAVDILAAALAELAQ